MKKATLMALAGALTMATATVNAETKSVKAECLYGSKRWQMCKNQSYRR